MSVTNSSTPKRREPRASRPVLDMLVSPVQSADTVAVAIRGADATSEQNMLARFVVTSMAKS